MVTGHGAQPDSARTPALRHGSRPPAAASFVQSRSAGAVPPLHLLTNQVMILSLSLKLAALLLPVSLPLAFDGNDPGAGAPGLFITNSSAICNCTTKTATLTVSHQSSVSVEVGNGVSVTAETGQSGSASQDTPPNKCLYLQYNFSCSRGWFGWSCTLTSTSLKQRDANGDCR
jgi:hypothetical protein